MADLSPRVVAIENTTVCNLSLPTQRSYVHTVRFLRWSKLGVWDAVFETLPSLSPPAYEEHAVETTFVRAHQYAVGAIKGNQGQEALRRSRGGFSTKIHRRTIRQGQPAGMIRAAHLNANRVAGVVVKYIEVMESSRSL